MSTNIMINKTHIVDSSNSSFVYRCPSELIISDGDKIAVSKLNLFYSWFNVSERHGNNKINFLWWDANGDLTDTYTCVITDGYYTVGTLNEALFDFMARNKLYLISKDGKNNVYFIKLRANSASYQIEVVYSSLCETYTDGTAAASLYTDWFIMLAGATWKPPTSYEIPQLIIPSTSNFGLLIGQPIGSIIPAEFPTPTSNVAGNYTIGSQFAPEMEPSTSFYITCSLCENSMSIPNNLLDSFTLTSDVEFGQMMAPLASERVWSRCKHGQYREIRVSIFDQSFNLLRIQDPNILMILSIMH